MFLLSDRAIKNHITIFRNHIRDKTKFCYSSRHSQHYEKRVFSPPWLVNFILSHVIAKDGSRFVIPLSERKIELNFIGWFTMSVVQCRVQYSSPNKTSTVNTVSPELEVEIYSSLKDAEEKIRLLKKKLGVEIW